MIEKLEKLRKLLREQGPRETARVVERALRQNLIDTRTIVVMKVDLSNANNRVKANTKPLTLHPFGASILPRVLDMLRFEDRDRIANVEARCEQGVAGAVAEDRGEIAGYVFWARGNGAASRAVHPDVEWLGIEPAADELYVSDYFVPARFRGLGAPFVRHVQEHQHRQGFKTAYGYVYLSNRPAAWLYRTTGWTEVRQLVEHRMLFDNFVALDGVLWRRHRWHRSRLGRMPGSDLLPRPEATNNDA